MKSNFVIFVISHGRPDNLITLRTLERCGYKGPCYVVIDDEDKTGHQYVEKLGEKSVLIFDKKEYASRIDSADNFEDRRTTTHARNACFDFAESLGFENFLVLDDDYSNFCYNFTSTGQFLRAGVKSFGALAAKMFHFMNTDDRIRSVCFIQGGDLIGGVSAIESGCYPFLKRKSMNSFFCKVSRRFQFFSRLNEDVNTYLIKGSRGEIFMSIPDIALNQQQTQASSGGMSDAYHAAGTYVKTFYSVMICPSFVKVSLPTSDTASTIRRIHHRVSWNNAVPKILDQSKKKQ